MRWATHPSVVFEAALFSEVHDHAWVVWVNYFLWSIVWLGVWSIVGLLIILVYSLLGLPAGATAYILDRVLIFTTLLFLMPVIANAVKFAGSCVQYVREGVNPFDEVWP